MNFTHKDIKAFLDQWKLKERAYKVENVLYMPIDREKLERLMKLCVKK